MNVNEARELLKVAIGAKTYPISRFITSPKAMGLTLGGTTAAALGALALAAGSPALAVAAPLVGAAYGGATYLSTRLSRFMHARALHSRAMRGAKQPLWITGSEGKAIKALKNVDLDKLSFPMHPISEALTSRVGWSALNAGLALAGNPANAVGIVTSPIGAHISRAVHARALMGRLALKKGLQQSEFAMASALHQKKRDRLFKLLTVGAVVAGGATAAGLGAKKLVEQDSVA